jgi:hypothetical protein
MEKHTCFSIRKQLIIMKTPDFVLKLAHGSDSDPEMDKHTDMTV